MYTIQSKSLSIETIIFNKLGADILFQHCNKCHKQGRRERPPQTHIMICMHSSQTQTSINIVIFYFLWFFPSVADSSISVTEVYCSCTILGGSHHLGLGINRCPWSYFWLMGISQVLWVTSLKPIPIPVSYPTHDPHESWKLMPNTLHSWQRFLHPILFGFLLSLSRYVTYILSLHSLPVLYMYSWLYNFGSPLSLCSLRSSQLPLCI